MDTNTNYDVDYFINKLSKIPERKWTTCFYYDNTLFGTKHCVLGLCGAHDSMQESKEAMDLFDLFFNNLNYISVMEINDGKIQKYNQPTPKQRIIAALHDLKSKIESEKVQAPEPEKPRERIVYVTVDRNITYEAEKLVEAVN